VEVVTSFASASAVLSAVLTAVLSAVLAATRVDQLVYLGGAFVLRCRDHRDRKFPLGAVARLHDFTNAQTAMLGGDVRLLTIS
jgi:polysaccharide pyruvyl transferase WcaK-like protein